MRENASKSLLVALMLSLGSCVVSSSDSCPAASGPGFGFSGSSSGSNDWLKADFCKADVTALVEADDATLRLVEAYKVLNFSDPAACGASTSSPTQSPGAGAGAGAEAEAACAVWLSVGYPVVKPLVRLGESADQSEVTTFLFSQSGFSVRVQLLSASDKLALARSASAKYGVTVLPSQFVEMPISRLNCRLRLHSADPAISAGAGAGTGAGAGASASSGLWLGSGGVYTYFGNATRFVKSPYAVRFALPPDGAVRRLAEQSLKVWNSPIVTDRSSESHEFDQLDCRVVYAENQTLVTRLALVGDEYNSLIPKVVGASAGNASVTYLTRTQFAQFAAKLYELFDVSERFETEPLAFEQALLDDLVEAGALSSVREFNVSTVLERLSPLGRLPNCVSALIDDQKAEEDAADSDSATAADEGSSEAAELLKELTDIFKSASRNQSARINYAWLEELRDMDKLQSNRYCGVMQLSRPFDDAAWTNSRNLSLGELIRDINSQAESDVVWQSTRNRNVIPRALKAMQVDNQRLRQLRSLGRVRRVDYVAAYTRDFRLSFTKLGLKRSALGETQVASAVDKAVESASSILARNISQALSNMEARYQQLQETYASRLDRLENLTLELAANLSQSNSALNVVEVFGYEKASKCLDGFTLVAMHNSSLLSCATRCNTEDRCVGFNFFSPPATQAGLCQLKMPISGVTFSSQASVSRGCTFYYHRCKVTENTTQVANNYYTSVGSPRSQVEAVATCARLRQHLVETRTSVEGRAIPRGSTSSYECFWQNAVWSTSAYSYIWGTDNTRVDTSTLGTLYDSSGEMYIATYFSTYRSRLEWAKASSGWTCIPYCQCTEYSRW